MKIENCKLEIKTMPYKITRFPNGLRLITATLRETKAVAILILVKVGSRYESMEVSGVSHFIEHMMFKGTKKRPTTLDLSRELDSVGAEYNAYTSKEHTGYHIKVQEEKIDLAFDVLADMLFSSKFEAEELDRERGTIIEEINMYEDNPIMYVPAFFEETMFGSKNSLGQKIIGSRANIRAISRQSMLNFKNLFYQPHNLILAVCGNFSDSRIAKLTDKYFSLAGHGRPVDFKKISQLPQKVNIAIRKKETEQVQLCLGFPGYAYSHKNREALDLLAIILGGNMSSRLFIEVRERRGLCYFIRSSSNPYHDIGSFMIQAGLDKKRIEEAILVIMGELKKVVEHGVTSEELQKAKDYIKGQVILNFEDSMEIAEFYADQLFALGKIEAIEQKIKKIEAVKVEAVLTAAREIFNFKRITLTLIGPFAAKDKFLKLLR